VEAAVGIGWLGLGFCYPDIMLEINKPLIADSLEQTCIYNTSDGYGLSCTNPIVQ